MTEQKKLEKIKLFLDKEDYGNAITLLEKYVQENSEEATYYWYLGLAYLLKGCNEEAQNIWLSLFLQGNLEDIENLTFELIVFLEFQIKESLKNNKLENAKIMYEAIEAIDPDYQNIELLNSLVESLVGLALSLSSNDHKEMAVEVLLEILKLSPEHSMSWYYLALNYYDLSWYSESKEASFKAIKMKNLSTENLYILNSILKKIKGFLFTVEEYQQLIKEYPTSINIHYNLGNFYYQKGEINEAIKFYKIAIGLFPASHRVPIFYRMGAAYEAINNQDLSAFYYGYFAYSKRQYQSAISYFEKFLSSQEGDIVSYTALANCYMSINQPLSAIALIEKALILFPNSLSLKRLNQIILPIIYKNTEEIELYRQRFCKLLNKLIEETNSKLGDTKEEQSVIDSLQVATNFYLSYQGQNDVDIHRNYGNYIDKIVKRIYPQWCQITNLNQIFSRKKIIRVGYLSLHLHGLGKFYLGWIKYINKNKFETFIYDISGYDKDKKDNQFKYRENFQAYGDHIKFITGEIDEICTNIIADNLDILIFPEIGLDTKMIPLSCLRLAPIQCTTWAHPITSGSPTIDYFLSSNLMEPKSGDEHYSETLVRLPNLGFSIEHPDLISSNKKRSDFMIADDTIVYFCSQTLFKYLPQYDYIFPSIAQHNELAQFVFLDSYLGPVITNSFKKRIISAFVKFDLDYEKYCLFLPRQSSEDYIRLNQLSDIFLDSFSWSGGISTIDAIACSVPVVTCPGEMMRSRHSYGILNMIGVTETIAETEAEYIEIAVRLGLDYEWRQTVRDKITANKHRLFNDQECIKGLEKFFEETVYNHSQTSLATEI
jgi:predicted O-linked N-acetylglucosamine transferase (SPINDLY family)